MGLLLLLMVTLAHCSLPPPSQVVGVIDKAFTKWKDQYPKPGNCKWEWGVYFTGHMAMYNVTGNATALQYALDWGNQNDWTCQQSKSVEANRLASGRAYAHLSLIEDTPEWRKPTSEELQRLLVHNNASMFWWVDAMYMGSATFTLFAILEDEPHLESFLTEIIHTTVDRSGHGLWDSKKHLFWRDWHYVNTDIYWGRGNGWAIAGIAQMLGLKYNNASFEAYLLDIFKKQAAALLPWQGKDGLWRSDITHPSHYPNPETTSTSLITAALAWGISAGVLDNSTYMPVVEKAWHGLTTISLHSDGFVGYCQPGGAAPAPATKSDTSPFCLGNFLLAAANVFALAGR